MTLAVVNCKHKINYKGHVANAAHWEVVVIGTIATRCAGKHYVVSGGKVRIHDRRDTFRSTVMLCSNTPHSLTVIHGDQKTSTTNK